MTRIRRIFIAALAATALTASMGAASAPASSSASASARCSWEGFNITKRDDVTCKKAKRVLKGAIGPAEPVKGWSCSKGSTIIPEGRCRNKAKTKSFKYKHESA
ncbi:MAG: hypothetical protein QOJ22_679 [Thermoleophilaceae bacterium]|jgi:hypothetical protein|nr:hypothetical protein [Thermoleophilaceae bacterium]